MARAMAALVVAAVGALAVGCTDEATDPDASLEGEAVEVLAVWQDVEAERFRAVLDAFEGRSGATVSFTSAEGRDIGTVLDERLVAQDPPDVAVVPLPALIHRYAELGAIHPLDDVLGEDAVRLYAPVWRDLATVDERAFGVWIKAAHKSLIWYGLAVLEERGAVPPADVDGLVELARDLAAAGVPAFAVGGADAWTLTDVFENLYLRVAGPEGYDELTERRRPWTHHTVVEALGLMAQLLAPGLVAGGAEGALATTFPESVALLAGDPPGAAMLAGADFVAGFLAEAGATLSVDVDAFVFPELGDSGQVVVGGGDAAVLLVRSRAGDALVRYLASAEAGELWAGFGGFLSPNEGVDLGAYPDDRSRAIARSLLEAGDGFRFDLSDQQPVDFGGTAGHGMLGILRDFVADPSDPAATARRLEEAYVAASEAATRAR
jgi:alpha-glucoside transport system substrate-binding protein